MNTDTLEATQEVIDVEQDQLDTTDVADSSQVDEQGEPIKGTMIAGHLKLALTEKQLNDFALQARTLNGARQKGEKAWTPNSILLSYAVRAFETWGADEAAAATAIADQRAAERAEKESVTKEQRALIKAQKLADRLAAQAAAAAAKAESLNAKAAEAKTAAVEAQAEAGSVTDEQVQITPAPKKAKKSTQADSDAVGALEAAESEMIAAS